MSNSFIFNCPFCKQRLDCDNDLESKTVACPSCNREIVPARNEFEGKIRIADQPSANFESGIKSESTRNDMPVMNQNCSVGHISKPKQRLVYILLGIVLGGLGVHNFYAGYYKEGLIQLALCAIGMMTSPPGFILCLGVSAWALANIICRLEDERGVPMV